MGSISYITQMVLNRDKWHNNPNYIIRPWQQHQLIKVFTALCNSDIHKRPKYYTKSKCAIAQVGILIINSGTFFSKQLRAVQRHPEAPHILDICHEDTAHVAGIQALDIPPITKDMRNCACIQGMAAAERVVFCYIKGAKT